MDKQKNKCINCKHFVQYYRIYNSYFMPLPHGHCEKRRLTPRQLSLFPFSEACDMWEPREELKKQRAKSIKQSLDRIQDTLDDVRQILTAEQSAYEDE